MIYNLWHIVYWACTFREGCSVSYGGVSGNLIGFETVTAYIDVLYWMDRRNAMGVLQDPREHFHMPGFTWRVHRVGFGESVKPIYPWFLKGQPLLLGAAIVLWWQQAAKSVSLCWRFIFRTLSIVLNRRGHEVTMEIFQSPGWALEFEVSSLVQESKNIKADRPENRNLYPFG